jgi:uncharacterized protein YndB with AHSA1/START domain
MTRFARSIRIEAPAADVWAAMMDVETWPTWASQFKRLERLDGGPLGQGSRVRVRPKGQLATVWQVTEFEPGRSFTWASDLLPGLRVTGGHELTSGGNATDAEFWLEASGALGRLLSPVLRRTVFSSNTRSATEGIKRHMEARRPAGAS